MRIVLPSPKDGRERLPDAGTVCFVVAAEQAPTDSLAILGITKHIYRTNVARTGKHKGWHAVQTTTGRYYLLGESMMARMGSGVGNVGSVR